MRKATISRNTAETKINLTLDLDGTGKSEIATGVGFMWAPWDYSAAWLLLISSLAYTIPQIDTVLALATTVARHTVHAARHAHDWLAALADRRQSPARVVRSTTHMEAGR